MVCVGGGTSAIGTAIGVESTTTGSLGALSLFNSTIFAWTFASFSLIFTSCFACEALTPFASPWLYRSKQVTPQASFRDLMSPFKSEISA